MKVVLVLVLFSKVFATSYGLPAAVHTLEDLSGLFQSHTESIRNINEYLTRSRSWLFLNQRGLEDMLRAFNSTKVNATAGVDSSGGYIDSMEAKISTLESKIENFLVSYKSEELKMSELKTDRISGENLHLYQGLKEKDDAILNQLNSMKANLSQEIGNLSLKHQDWENLSKEKSITMSGIIEALNKSQNMTLYLENKLGEAQKRVEGLNYKVSKIEEAQSRMTKHLDEFDEKLMLISEEISSLKLTVGYGSDTSFSHGSYLEELGVHKREKTSPTTLGVPTPPARKLPPTSFFPMGAPKTGESGGIEVPFPPGLFKDPRKLRL